MKHTDISKVLKESDLLGKKNYRLWLGENFPRVVECLLFGTCRWYFVHEIADRHR